MKKKLVIQTIPGRKKIDHGKKFLFKKCLWSFEFHYEIDQGLMEAIELNLDKKITLIELLEIIQEKAKELIPDGRGDCGYKIFRVKN